MPSSLEAGVALVRSAATPAVLAALPALAVLAWFVGGMLPYMLVVRRRGAAPDPEVLARGRTLLVGFFLRQYFFWWIGPVWRLLLQSGLPATAVTTLATLLGVGAGIAAGAGAFAVAGWLFLGAGICDALDGRLARSRGEATPAGAALDSVLDRYTDSALLIGLAWFYRESWVLLPVLAALLGSSLVPYVRARGEALGVPLRGGQLQRLERVLVLGIAVAFSPIADAALAGAGDPPRHWLAVGGIVFVAVGSNVTAITRLLDLLRRLAGAPSPAAARPLSSTVGLDLLGSGLATAADFGLALALYEGPGVPAALATALGSFAGGLLHFGFSRGVTYRSGRPGLPQLGRYILVSASGLLLNVGGIALLLLHAELRYAWAWWLVRAAVYVLWSFPLQRSWVFGDARPSEGLTHAQ